MEISWQAHKGDLGKRREFCSPASQSAAALNGFLKTQVFFGFFFFNEGPPEAVELGQDQAKVAVSQ